MRTQQTVLHAFTFSWLESNKEFLGNNDTPLTNPNAVEYIYIDNFITLLVDVYFYLVVFGTEAAPS